MPKRGQYLGGSTIVQRRSDWFGKGEFKPERWGPESPDEAFSREPKRAPIPDFEDKEQVLERQRKRKAERRLRRKLKKKKSKEEKILEKYQSLSSKYFRE